MIVFKWEKWDTYSTILLKEFLKTKAFKFWKWKSTIFCHTTFDFKVFDIKIDKDTERYAIFTTHGIYEADEIEVSYNGNHEDSNSTWSRNG